MVELVRTPQFRLSGAGLLITVLVFAVTLGVTTGIGSLSSGVGAVDRLALLSQGADDATQSLPTTVEKATPVGWNGSIRCLPGTGRFYRKLVGDEADPIMLLFDADGRLIGLNLYSSVEQPAPWGHLPNGLQAGVDGRDSEYWDLNIFVRQHTAACQTNQNPGRREFW